jgi:hypothetical protein
MHGLLSNRAEVGSSGSHEKDKTAFAYLYFKEDLRLNRGYTRTKMQ